MDSETFTRVFSEQVRVSEDILVDKSRDYATEDQLHNFKVAAALKGETPQQALAGMMAKHTVSIYDMCRSNEKFDLDKWNEKITDHINYLILLKAIVIEQLLTADDRYAQLEEAIENYFTQA